MTERLLVAASLIAAIALAIAAARLWLRLRDRRILARLLAGKPPASEGATTPPRIVYFTTRSCVVCRAQQEPALERLRARLPELRLERHDAVADAALAGEYGVLSVPTTAVFDRAGRLVTINRGFAPASVLLAQIEGREPSMEGGLAMAAEPLQE
ncbi:MAG: thioredoxin family protein [Chloroflexi bacterium]|nr:thioredoxin family protein [Chloroflexota bacterium]